MTPTKKDDRLLESVDVALRNAEKTLSSDDDDKRVDAVQQALAAIAEKRRKKNPES